MMVDRRLTTIWIILCLHIILAISDSSWNYRVQIHLVIIYINYIQFLLAFS